MARVERLRVFPIKGLDGIDVETAPVLEGGTLKYDREFALFDADGNVINGKRTERVHEITTDFDPNSGALWVETPRGDTQQFDLHAERTRAERWFSDCFDLTVTIKRDTSLGFVDRRELGPSIVSTATLETVASWFDRLTVEGARRRFRANVEVSGVPAFWEDRFVGEGAPAFEIDGVPVDGVTPCGRCVVPQRHPDTGESIPEFRERFVEKRKETFPEWADDDAFDHYYCSMIIARVPQSGCGETIDVGDDVRTIRSESARA